MTVDPAPGECHVTGIALGVPVTSDNGGETTVINDAPEQFQVGITVVTWTATDAHGNTNSCQQTVRVSSSRPVILSDPQDATQDAGAEATFAVSVFACEPSDSPTAPTYQWYFFATNALDGATNSILTISNVQPAHAGAYTVVVSNEGGSVTSYVAMLVVSAPGGRISGLLELELFAGASRLVTFQATDRQGAVLKTWDLALSFAFDGHNGVASYGLSSVPLNTANLCAKTTWNLRKRRPVVFANGEATANFTGGSSLPGGDLDGSNSCNDQDFSTMAANWYEGVPFPPDRDPGSALLSDLPCDIDGNGIVNTEDYFIMANNWQAAGDSLAEPVTVTGLVELEYFVGTVRLVTLKATDALGTVVKTWSLPLNFAGGVASYALSDVPPETIALSAKTAWHLRQKLALPWGQIPMAVDFVGGNELLGGDFDDSNVCDIFDYFILGTFWYTHAPVADIDGNGWVDLDDYFLLADNWYLEGDPE